MGFGPGCARVPTPRLLGRVTLGIFLIALNVGRLVSQADAGQRAAQGVVVNGVVSVRCEWGGGPGERQPPC